MARIKGVGRSRLIDFNGDVLITAATTPLPQGSRVGFSIRLDRQERTIPIRGKVASVLSRGEGVFHIAIRCHGLSRAARRALRCEVEAENVL